METVDALMGKFMNGGGRKKKSSTSKKTLKRSKSTKLKTGRMQFLGMNVPKKYRMGFFGGDQKMLMCTEVQMPGPTGQPGVISGPQGTSGPTVLGPPNMPQGGGAKMKLAIYKKKLDNLNVDKLQKMAVRKGVKITKKKDGKAVYIKKATLVRKLCECKIGRKIRKKSTKPSSRH